MNRPIILLLTRFLCLACLVFVSSCIATSKPTTLYTLQPAVLEKMSPQFDSFAHMILIMPVRLAPHLRNQGLLIRHSATESKASVSHLWAGPLDQQIAETLAANVKNLLGTSNISTYPGPRYGSARYQVEIDIADFSGDERTFSLQAVWTISDSVRKTLVSRKSFQVTRDIDKPDLSGYVASASSAISELSKEVATALLAAHTTLSPVPSHEN